MNTAITDTEAQLFHKISSHLGRCSAVLEEHYVASGVSLTEARVLLALGGAGMLSGREVCGRLGLDAGYVSRMVKGFVARELVHKRASVTDGRQVDLVLTVKGRKLVGHFKACEREEVAKLLAGISGHKRVQMLRAMGVIERALETPDAMAGVVVRPPRTGDVSWVVHRQAVLYREEFGWDERFEALLHHIADTFITKFKPAREAAWIAEYGGEIVGSMFLIEQGPGVAQLRMLYVEPHARGLGIGKRLLEKSVAFAQAKHYGLVRLWTNTVFSRAVGMYARAGFTLVEETPHNEFGEGLVAQVWEKLLA